MHFDSLKEKKKEKKNLYDQNDDHHFTNPASLLTNLFTIRWKKKKINKKGEVIVT